jgi:hypothetical protein
MKTGKNGETLEAPFGRFWALTQLSDDEDEDDRRMGDATPSPSAVASQVSETYFCRSPSPVACSLQKLTMTAVARREEKRRNQREAALALRSGECFGSSFVDSPVFECRSSARKTKVRPVLPPSTFLLDSFVAADWILVQRRKRSIRWGRPFPNAW